MRKRRTREHIIADLSVNYVQRFFLRAGHTADRVTSDYGYDLFVQTFDEAGYLETEFLVLQLKASDNPRRVAEGTALAVTILRGDLELWTANRTPVFLILYDATTEEAWWREIENVSIGAMLSQTEGDTITLRIPTENRLTLEAIDRIREIKNHRWSV